MAVLKQKINGVWTEVATEFPQRINGQAITKELLHSIDSNFAAENIKKDVSVFGLVGTYGGEQFLTKPIVMPGYEDSGSGGIVQISSTGVLAKDEFGFSIKAVSPNFIVVSSDNKIDVTDYDTLLIVVDRKGSNPLRVGFSSGKVAEDSFDGGSISVSSTAGAQRLALDISSLSGEWYLKAFTSVYTAASHFCYLGLAKNS